MRLAYTAIRFTGDLDIWLNPTPENASKIILCIKDFEFGNFKLIESDFIKPGNVIQLGYPPLRIDLLTEIDGVSFSECFTNKITVEIDDLLVFFIGYEDLLNPNYAIAIVMKVKRAIKYTLLRIKQSNPYGEGAKVSEAIYFAAIFACTRISIAYFGLKNKKKSGRHKDLDDVEHLE